MRVYTRAHTKVLYAYRYSKLKTEKKTISVISFYINLTIYNVVAIFIIMLLFQKMIWFVVMISFHARTMHVTLYQVFPRCLVVFHAAQYHKWYNTWSWNSNRMKVCHWKVQAPYIVPAQNLIGDKQSHYHKHATERNSKHRMAPDVRLNDLFGSTWKRCEKWKK